MCKSLWHYIKYIDVLIFIIMMILMLGLYMVIVLYRLALVCVIVLGLWLLLEILFCFLQMHALHSLITL